MEGISTSIDMFDHNKRTVFLYGDYLGKIASLDNNEFEVEPINKPKRIVTGEKQAIEYLITCNKRPAPPKQQENKRQIALF